MTSPPTEATPRFWRRPRVIATERNGALLVAPVVGGVALLDRSAALRGDARAIWEELGAELGVDDAAAVLLRASPDVAPDRAAADARAFLLDLEVRGLVEGPRGRAQETTAPPVDVSLPSAALARAAVAAGCALRFTARGRSMRPLVPDGSLLDVVPLPDRLPLGCVLLHVVGDERLVAHRVVGRAADAVLTRGDSSLRLDRVPRSACIGVVAGRWDRAGCRHDLSRGAARWRGLLLGLAWRWAAGAARGLVVLPLRPTLRRRSALRDGLQGVLGIASGALLRLEAAAFRMRRAADVVRSVLGTAREKEERSRRLYARRAVQDFTALDENVEAGLTLVEEVLFHRHRIDRGRALVLGCGPGRESVALARMGFEVTGVDRDPGMVARARALAERHGQRVRFLVGDATALAFGAGRFDVVVAFSGLYGLVSPRSRRVALLRSVRDLLRPGGRLLLTFLSAYVPPGTPPPPRGRTFLEALNPDHDDGDRFLRNEVVHVVPHPARLEEEAGAGGFVVDEVYRDQRAYDRARGQVRGYAVLVRP